MAKNRQKLLALLVAGTLALGGLSGCGQAEEQEDEQAEEQSYEETYTEDDDTTYFGGIHKKKSKHSSGTSFLGLGSSAKGSASS